MGESNMRGSLLGFLCDRRVNGWDDNKAEPLFDAGVYGVKKHNKKFAK